MAAAQEPPVPYWVAQLDSPPAAKSKVNGIIDPPGFSTAPSSAPKVRSFCSPTHTKQHEAYKTKEQGKRKEGKKADVRSHRKAKTSKPSPESLPPPRRETRSK